MNKKKISILLASFSLFTSFSILSSTPAYTAEVTQGVQWRTDYEAAKQESAATGKPMVLFFTGSDWCTWCVKLEKEVFNQPEFARNAGNEFIFVKLDFPRRSNQDPRIKEQNKKLQDFYHIDGYPSIIMVDPNGKKLAKTGYRAGGALSYAQHLQGFKGSNTSNIAER